jgi:pilus assembly protein CpaF
VTDQHGGLAERVRRRLSDDPVLSSGEGTSLPAVRSAVARAVRDEGVLLPPAALGDLVREVTDELAGLGAVQPLLRDPDVTDVMVNGPDEVWVERAGRLERTTVTFPDGDAIRAAVLRVVGPLGLRLDRSRPYVDARLADGSRLHAVLPPLSAGSPVVTIRRFPSVSHDWAALERTGAVPPDAAALLCQAVADRRAIVVCGRTGTGKTTLLNVLLGDVTAAERVVVIEDAPELRPRCPHVVRLETRPANAEGAGEITIRDLVRQALRMRPDRIVVGEVRGIEIADVLQALATGHEGCMTTVHAKAADEALVRLEGMALQAQLPLEAARAQLAVGLDLLVVCSRGPDGRRGLTQVAQVERYATGALTTRDLWRRERWA